MQHNPIEEYTGDMSANLTEYIAEARNHSIGDEQIKQALLNLGWPQDQVNTAFSQTTPDSKLPMPPLPPAPVPHVGMWVGFLYILFFISLYILATAIGVLFHNYVDSIIPNKIETDFSDSTFIRGCIAALIVSYPIFIALALTLKKQLVKQPLVRNLRSRKLLIYITLIGTFLIMLGHIIMTIYEFLNGSLSTSALAHLTVTFLVAGAIFAYFINEVKYDRKTN